MADHLSALHQSLFHDKLTPADLVLRIRSDVSVKHGLELFYLITSQAVSSVESVDPDRNSNKTLGFQFWTDSQINSVFSLGLAIVSASRSLSVEQSEPLVVAVVQQLLEFAVCFLERSEFSRDDLSTQGVVLLLMELALVGDTGNIPDSFHSCSLNMLLELLPTDSGDRGSTKLESHINCSLQGVSCPKGQKPVDQLLRTLASESIELESSSLELHKPKQDLSNFIVLSQHWAMMHVDCVCRLMSCCRDLINLPYMCYEKMGSSDFCRRLSFGLRIMKLLRNLMTDSLHVGYDASLLKEVGLFADALPSLFRIGFEFSNNQCFVEGSSEDLILSLLAEFLLFVQVAFSNSSAFVNIETCIVASLLENLDSSVWRYNKSAVETKLPLVYFPQSVTYMLKLIQDVKRKTFHALDLEGFDAVIIGGSDEVLDNVPTCHVRSEEIPLVKRFKMEELMKIIFPSTTQWVDNLMHLVLFLHCEGVKLRSKVELPQFNSLKANYPSEIENSVCNEEEALFGNLFSEGSRSVGSSEGYDQPPVPVNTCLKNSNMPMQAATELLNFLKESVYSPGFSLLFEDGCNGLRESHIDLLLSILCSKSDRNVAAHDESSSGQIHEVCFELLHKLLTCHALSSALEKYLVDQILNAESHTFVYDEQILILLSHMLLSRAGVSGNQLRTKLYSGFTDFIADKAKTVCSECPGIKEFVGTLPPVFHIEILLIAFHLSSDEEKAAFANLVFASLKSIDVPSSGFSASQLSCWALLVSRLIVLLRHMIFHSHTCPPSLLLDMRAKLREPGGSGLLLPDSLNDQMASWASTVVKSVMGSWIQADPSISGLIYQLIDISTPHPSFFKEALSVELLCLSWDDVCATFSWILGFWKGKKAAAVEDLIIERYMFSLCLDIPILNSSLDNPVVLHESHSPDTSDVAYFFRFSHSLIAGGDETCKVMNFPEVIDVVRQLCAVSMPEDSNELGWDFLRNGFWLSLVLSLLNFGVDQYCFKNGSSGIKPVWVANTTRDNLCLGAAEGLVSCLIERDEVFLLLRMLSSLLNKYLLIYEKAFLSSVGGHSIGNGFSSLLLLKHSNFGGCLQDELLKHSGFDSSQLQSFAEFLSNWDALVDRRAPGARCKMFWECVLHGFPCQLHTSSATVLSSMLSIRAVILFLDRLFKLEDLSKTISNERELFSEIVSSVMMIKYDRIFENIQGKCDSILANLGPGVALTDYTDLFLMKHMERFLRELNASEDCDGSILEWAISKTIDIAESLRKDPLKSSMLRFYLNSEDEPVNDLHGLPHGDLFILLEALDKCAAEPVNVKVLNFFIDLLSGDVCSQQKVQEKFFRKDTLALSKWLEKRLLGTVEEGSDGISCLKGNVSLREATVQFILCIVPSPDSHLIDGSNNLYEAVLASLDTAFLLCDVHVAKSYFHFVVQLSRGEYMIKLLLRRTVLLMEKLGGDVRLLPGLKFLFGFLRNVLNDCGSSRSIMQKSSGKSASDSNFDAHAVAMKPISSRKNSETVVLSANEGGSAVLECDSVDEDEDDGTSDGEVASIDKDEEDDTNSERVLASKVCTFTSSGSNFMEQHWYFCYTCDLTVSKGCCSVCAKVCHRGHRVVYSRSSRFFCDCGAGGVRGSNCQCLKPRKFTGSDSVPLQGASNFQLFLPFTDSAGQLPDSDSDLDEDLHSDTDNALRLSISRELQDEVKTWLEELDVKSRVLRLCSSLLPAITSKRESNFSNVKKVCLGEDKVLSYDVELLQLKKAYKGGSLDLKIKADYPNSKDLRSHLISGSLAKSLLSISNRGRLAVGEGDKVAIFDVGQLIGQATMAPATADKTNIKPLSRNAVRFEIVHLTFNSVIENYLAVAGYEDCQVVTLNHRGEVTDRLSIELALQGAYIRRIDWVPGSQVKLMVVTDRFIKIYDLSQDNISPLHYITLYDDVIVDATLLMASQGRMLLIVLSEKGCLFRLELSIEGNVGATPLTEMIQMHGKEINAKGSSLYFSSTYKLLLVSYQNGTTLMCRLSSDATSLSEMSFVYEGQDVNIRSAGLHRWRELLIGSGLFVCASGVNSSTSLVVSVGPNELHAQCMRHVVSSTSQLVGLAAYKPLSKDKVHCLVLHDDGSLQIYSHIPAGSDAKASSTSDKVKKLSAGILNKAYAGLKPEFPLDFFEKTFCMTADVKFGGDAIRNGDSEAAKNTLASEDGFLESPNPAGFKISISNSNPDIVMVGLRVHVGNTSASHIPSDITIFQRVIKFDEGIRSWYDIPFTEAESLLADEEVVVSIGPTFNGTALPRIDSLEVYGRSKDEFGWKEKWDRAFDMETQMLGSNSLHGGSGKKGRSIQAASIQEQVVADGLKLLSRLYPLCRFREDAKVELCEIDCKLLLETIFESDREPMLQAAACRVLQSLFPEKDKYHQVKDAMRLQGVVKSTSALSSRLGLGGSTGGWMVEEFTAQMRAVSKIALNRRSNLALFLESNGTDLVDGLMQVLWDILEFEQPDTQTMNNIVIASVELIYCYAECLALHGKDTVELSVAPAVKLLKKLLFSPNEAVQTSSSLAISSKFLQVPFPKQTMLTTDDAVDIAASASGLAEADSGNTQLMIEEDNITSSVQYCCDGCSTVPILRRRWHCTICPDFDLCEACYQVLEADRLPPPHSRDHPMTAIPVEVEPLVGDSNEIHFSTGDGNESNLMPLAVDASMQTSTPSIDILEPNESGNFSISVTDAVSISASKRAVNSLLLSELLEQLKGWMETTSGVHAIPIMQLFYRLSSAVGGPFIDSSKPEALNLEKLVQWFLNEIDLGKPFVASSRSYFGEVAVLVFMFFTLMLRNWHQPGSDGSIPKSSVNVDLHDKNTSQLNSAASQSSLDSQEKNDFTSQLLRACSLLRNQPFINYLMDILQQLAYLFKSPAFTFESSHGQNSGSGCGALLTVRKDLPAGNFSPFFSDSYVKAHRTDIFMDYHRLLLENTFRLVYTLVRPEKHEKTGEKDKAYKASSNKDLKLDGYQDVLCSYINNPHTTFVRRYARRLFLHLCGSKTHYYSVRDSWQFSTELKKLHKHINKSGGLRNPMPYERSVKIFKCLSTMAEVAAARPRNWQKYCLKLGDVLPFLVDRVFYFGEESVIQTLKLLHLAFYSGRDVTLSQQKIEVGDSGTSSKSSSQALELKKKKKGEEATESGTEKSYLDMETAVDIFIDKDGDVLRHFVDCFLLEWSSSSVRAEAKCVLYGAWHHGKQSFKETLLLVLFQKVKSLPLYGQNIVEFTELVTLFLGKAHESSSKQNNLELVDRCLTPDVISCIFETLRSQNELIANHPNSRIYNMLSGLVEFDGYYLESEPCVACSSPEVPYSKMKLESLKSETKFTDNRIIVKCTGSYTIQTVTMNVHDARKSKSVKVLNLYYNNRPVADLSELKNNWSLWKRAKSCHLGFNQTELKVEFPIPITACNFMIELDSFYENLQALSLEPLQCPRCSRPVTDKHGICGNCHENAYQCRQCRNINYENLDSFLCNECGYSKYGRFEFNFMAKPSFIFDNMENDDDMKKGLTAIESESENAHRRYQQLLGFKKPLLKIVSSIGENDMDSQQKDSVQQMMVSLPGPSCKINRKIALLGVLYGEKCKAAFDSVSKSVQTLQGLRRVLMTYLHHKHSDDAISASRFVVSRSPNNCYGCATTFVAQCLEILQVLSKHPNSKKQLVAYGILSELFENNIHQGPKTARVQARAVLCALSEGDTNAISELNNLIQKKVMYCLEHHRSMDIAVATREELLLLSEVCSLADEYWESRLRIVFQLLFSSIKLGSKHPAIAEHIILPCLRIISQACTPPKPDTLEKEHADGKPVPAGQLKDNNLNASGSLSAVVSNSKSAGETFEKNVDASHKSTDIELLSYSEWERGASYLDFVRRQYKVSQAVKGAGQRSRPQKLEFLTLKYALRWRRRTCKTSKGDLSMFELGSWVSELVLSACSQSIRSEMCMLISLLCAHSSSRQFRLLNLLMGLLPATLSSGESAAEYFELLFKMIDSEDARLFLTVRGCLTVICKLITEEVSNIESLERSLRIDISQGFILHKLIELLGKFLKVPNIRSRFMRDNLLSDILEALIVIRGLIVQKTKLISDCNQLLNDLLESLLLESNENKRQFIRACICGLQNRGKDRKGRNCLFILEQLCNLICPSKPEAVYLLVLNKAHTQEEFIRGSMTKNPYSSAEIGPLMRDVKNKICHQLDLLGLLEDDYGMELLVAGNIISLDLSIAQVYEQVWKKSASQSSSALPNSSLLSSGMTSGRDSSPMIVTYRLQGLDGEATEPMIKELEEDREESQDPEVEFAIAGAVREYDGFEILLRMIQNLRDDFKSNKEELVAVLTLLMHCCKIRENRRALLKLGALGLLLETARRAFSVDAMEPAEGILLIVESLTLEANESDNISTTQSALTVTNEEAGSGEQAKKIVLMFLERLCHPSNLKKSNKQQRNTEMVARILPYLTYGEPAAMEALIEHFNPYLQDWGKFDRLQKQHEDNPKDEIIAQKANEHRFTVENFVRVSESLKTSSCGERLKDIILEKGITGVAVKYLRESFAVAGQDGFKSSKEWSTALKLPSVPLILSMLRGLSMGHLATQTCLDEGGILPLLHSLEGVPGENEIGARAENLLDTLSNKEGKGDGFLEDKVRQLRHATRDEMRRRALRKREELLQGLGFRREVASDGGERIIVARPVLEGLEEVEEEEDGLACMVCREGYTLRPTDLLGVYSYSKRVNLGVGTSGRARGECVYTTVSYFNIIHFQCHQEAKRADAALRNPKKEWEGATLRNNESLCNSLFPVRGPSVPLAQYIRFVDQYWDNLNSLGRADGSRLRLLTYDIVLMLARFATGASFSADSRGGGRESNSRFLPFMIQMGRHLVEQGGPAQLRSMAKAVSSYINSSSATPGSQPSPGTEETVQFMLVNSLLSESYESWLQHRRSFLQRGIYHAYMQHTHGRSMARPTSPSTSETGTSEDLLSIVRPMLVYMGLIEKLQHFFKVKKSPNVKPEGTSGDEVEGWEVVMKERLLNVREMVGFSKELLAWLDEMNSASDLQEAFDVMGVLSDVLSGGVTRCYEFVSAAISAGKG